MESYPGRKFQQKRGEEGGAALETHYRHVLDTLGKEKGMLGVIFRKSQNRIQDPATLKRLLELINQETWIGLNIDVKGEIYEGLLQKNAEDIKGGAGQYFTPRPLIKAMVEVMRPSNAPRTRNDNQRSSLRHRRLHNRGLARASVQYMRFYMRNDQYSC